MFVSSQLTIHNQSCTYIVSSEASIYLLVKCTCGCIATLLIHRADGERNPTPSPTEPAPDCLEPVEPYDQVRNMVLLPYHMYSMFV